MDEIGVAAATDERLDQGGVLTGQSSEVGQQRTEMIVRHLGYRRSNSGPRCERAQG